MIDETKEVTDDEAADRIVEYEGCPPAEGKEARDWTYEVFGNRSGLAKPVFPRAATPEEVG
jgi:hypothetical protein